MRRLLLCHFSKRRFMLGKKRFQSQMRRLLLCHKCKVKRCDARQGKVSIADATLASLPLVHVVKLAAFTRCFNRRCDACFFATDLNTLHNFSFIWFQSQMRRLLLCHIQILFDCAGSAHYSGTSKGRKTPGKSARNGASSTEQTRSLSSERKTPGKSPGNLPWNGKRTSCHSQRDVTC
jgi:hypothetical protein